MKNRQFIVFALLLACPLLLHGQETFLCGKESCNKGYIRHPWYGKKVGYIGDSITDPNCYGDNIKKYWDFLKEWLDITPYVYGVSGRQWNDVPRQAEQLKKEHGEEVDAIVVLMGTVSIRPRACFFPLFSFLPLWLHYNLNPLCVQY